MKHLSEVLREILNEVRSDEISIKKAKIINKTVQTIIFNAKNACLYGEVYVNITSGMQNLQTSPTKDKKRKSNT